MLRWSSLSFYGLIPQATKKNIVFISKLFFLSLLPSLEAKAKPSSVVFLKSTCICYILQQLEWYLFLDTEFRWASGGWSSAHCSEFWPNTKKRRTPPRASLQAWTISRTRTTYRSTPEMSKILPLCQTFRSTPKLSMFPHWIEFPSF